MLSLRLLSGFCWCSGRRQNAGTVTENEAGRVCHTHIETLSDSITAVHTVVVPATTRRHKSHRDQGCCIQQLRRQKETQILTLEISHVAPCRPLQASVLHGVRLAAVIWVNHDGCGKYTPASSYLRSYAGLTTFRHGVVPVYRTLSSDGCGATLLRVRVHVQLHGELQPVVYLAKRVRSAQHTNLFFGTGEPRLKGRGITGTDSMKFVREKQRQVPPVQHVTAQVALLIPHNATQRSHPRERYGYAFHCVHDETRTLVCCMASKSKSKRLRWMTK